MTAATAVPGALWRRLRRGLDLVFAFLIPAGVYSAILAARDVYPFNPRGTYTVFSSDLDNQYAQFYSYFDQALTGHGSLMFTWRSDLGLNFWPIVSYYLTSPFGLFTLFASDRRLPIMIAFITILKIGTAGLAMQLLLRRFRRPRADGEQAPGSTAMAVVLSAGYALAAWTLVYAFNIMWLDALYLLPLVVLGIESLLAKGRIAPLALAFGVTFILNFYTGAMIGVFAVLYGIARYFGVRGVPAEHSGHRELFARADFLRTGLRFAIATVIGVLISAAFLLPAYSGGISQKTPLTATASVRPPVNALSVLIRFFGGTVDAGAKTPNVAAATLLLLLVPLFFTVKGVRRAERIAFGCVLAFLLAATEIQPLYLLMHGGDMPNAFPYRFAFLITALMVFLAFRAWVGIDSLRQVKQLIGLGALWLVVLYVGALTYGRILPRPVVRFDGMVLILGTALLAFALWLRVRNQDAPLPARVRKLPTWLFSTRTAALGAAAVLTVDVAGSALLVGQKEVGIKGSSVSWAGWYSRPSTSYGPALQALVPASDDFFRAEGNDRNLRSTNDSLRYGNFAQTHFSSLSSGKLHTTLADLGFAHYESYVWASHTGATLFTDGLLGYRYLVTTTRSSSAGGAGSTADLNRLGATLVKTYDDTKLAGSPDITKVWRVQDTLPVGFRLTDAELQAMLKPLPANDPYAAQEQVFQAPGAFEPVCGTPTVTGDGLTATPAADGGLDVAAKPGPKGLSVKVTWNCTSPGDRQVYLYSPRAFPGQRTYVRIDANGSSPADKAHPEDDPANKFYPFGFSNGIQDMGVVKSGPFTVTLNNDDVTTGRTYHIPPNAVRGLDAPTVSAKLAELRQGAVSAVHWDDTGMSATTSGDQAATVFFSVPSIPGWNVTVDGKTVQPTQLLGAFVGVPVPAGTHRIGFTFTPPGLKAGVGGSALGLAALGGVWWYQRRRASSRDAARATPEQIHEDVLS